MNLSPKLWLITVALSAGTMRVIALYLRGADCSPVPTSKNAWLLGRGLFIYLCGAIMTFNSERRALNTISA
jgi:hypothetical protein